MKTIINKFSRSYALPIALTLVTASCSDSNPTTSSEHVATSSLIPQYQVISDGTDTVTVEAQISYSAADRQQKVVLHSNDSLWLSDGGAISDLEFEEDLFSALANTTQAQFPFNRGTGYGLGFWGAVDYELDWYASKAPNTGSYFYRVILDRHGYPAAENSYVTLPKSFEVIAPIFSDTYSRATDEIIVQWETGNQTDVDIEIATASYCLSGESYTTQIRLDSDTGSYTLPPNSLNPPTTPDAVTISGRCSTSITVSKARIGTLDPIYKAGIIEARQLRSVKVVTEE